MTSHIRIPDITPVAQDVADGSRRTFEFPFPIFDAADLDILIGDVTVTTGFVVRGAGSSDGGAVVFATAPAAGLRVTLRRGQTYARTGDFPDEREPTPHELNDAIDQGVAAVQELDERLSRTVRRSPAADLSRAVDLTLPEPEAGRVLGWNGSADGLVNLAQVDTDDMLRKSRNLADLPDKAQARANLGLGSAAIHDASEFATAAQGAKADSALQPSAIGTAVEAHSANLDWVSTNLTAAGKTLLDDTDASAQRATLGLAAVAASGSYTDLSNTPALGSAAVHNAGDFATAAQGAKADSALQPSAIDTDVTLAANSDALVASQKAVKSYVNNAVNGGAVTHAGALVPLQTLTPSGVATVDFTAFDNSTYSSYLFVLENVQPATTDVMLYMRLSSNGGSSYYTASYKWNAYTDGTQGGGQNDDHMVLAYNRGFANQAISSVAGKGVCGHVWLYGAGDSSYSKVTAQLVWGDNDNAAADGTAYCFLATATPISAARFLMESGNIASGTIRMFGLKKA